MSYKVVDLFSGCGGMSWGLNKAGFDVVAGIDNWPIALKTFKRNHTDAIIYDTDIRDLDVGKVLDDLSLKKGELDCLIGGPPCQGFSKNVPASSRFLEDPRNQLFKDFLRFVEEMHPRVVIMENVAEIYNAFDGKVRDEIISSLNALGYDVNVQVLRVYEYGIPQRRRRCFFFASRTGVRPEMPEKEKGNFFLDSAWDAISDLPSLEDGEGESEMSYNKKPTNVYQRLMREGSDILFNHGSKKLRPKQFARISSLKPGQGFKDLPDDLRPRSGYSGAYGRLDLEMIAPTITRWVFHPGSGRYGHPKDVRLITIREAARIQSFSDDFIFEGTYTEQAGQIGNAVPPMMMKLFSENIKICLEDLKETQQPFPRATSLDLVQK